MSIKTVRWVDISCEKPLFTICKEKLYKLAQAVKDFFNKFIQKVFSLFRKAEVIKDQKITENCPQLPNQQEKTAEVAGAALSYKDPNQIIEVEDLEFQLEIQEYEADQAELRRQSENSHLDMQRQQQMQMMVKGDDLKKTDDA